MKRHRVQFHHDLPGEIMAEIFSRLPIKDLSHCRFVCKFWYQDLLNFVKDPFFVNLHFSRTNRDNDPTFLVLCHNDKSFGNKLYLVDNENPRTSLEAVDTNMDLPPPQEKIKIVGSANGLLCFSLLPNCDSFYIANPITRESVLLPKAPGLVKSKTSCGYSPSGFAFDATTSTYKVVHTWWFTDEVDGSKRTGVEIYTLGSGKWRRVEDIPNCIFRGEEIYQAVFLKGALHWATCYEANPEVSRWCIGVIDVATEKFRAFGNPWGFVGTRVLSLLGDRLCVIDHKVICYQSVWVLKEYGMAESWAKQYRIVNKGIEPLSKPPPLRILRTVTTKKNGSTVVVMHNGRYQGYYDFENQHFMLIEIRKVKFPWGADVDAVAHQGSLISPKAIATAEARECSPSTAKPPPDHARQKRERIQKKRKRIQKPV